MNSFLSLLSIVFSVFSLASCDVSEKKCSEPLDIEPEHKAVLACSGWLNYVEEHVCSIDYVSSIPPEQPNTKIYGRANCADATIIVSTIATDPIFVPIPESEVAATMVHEAAHLEDNCRDRETEAIKAEKKFFLDLCQNINARGPSCPMPRPNEEV